jgi:hypothetical protein
MFPVRYDLCFSIPVDNILHSNRRDNLKSYVLFRLVAMQIAESFSEQFSGGE